VQANADFFLATSLFLFCSFENTFVLDTDMNRVLKILVFLDTDMSRVPDDLSSLAEVWYLDGSSIYHNNNLGKKVLEKIIRDAVS
jgi:hypothetical protein